MKSSGAAKVHREAEHVLALGPNSLTQNGHRSISLEELSVNAVSRIVQTLPDHLMQSVVGATTLAMRNAALKKGLGVVERHLDLVLRDMVASGLGGVGRRYSEYDVPDDELFEYSLAHDMAYGLYDVFVKGIEEHLHGARPKKHRLICDESSDSD